jgi:predicted ribosome quality control (RQC) complex YloA/Tae2 family protein
MVIGHRVANIYNLSSKSFLFKLAGATKHFLLLESGVRLHTTQYSRDKEKTPSGFAAKLRKHLKLSRLENITQVGADRVVDFQFGSGEKAHHLILELYAQGNVILTDHKYEMLLVLRKFTYEAKEGDTEEAKVTVHEVYPLKLAREVDVLLDAPMLQAAIKKANVCISSLLTPSE